MFAMIMLARWLLRNVGALRQRERVIDERDRASGPWSSLSPVWGSANGDSLAASPGLKRVLFVAGDDRTAVSTVAGLITQLGLHPILLGSLVSAGRQMELGGIFSGLELFTPSKEAAAS